MPLGHGAFNSAMFFRDFRLWLSSWRRWCTGDKETRTITLETKGVTTFRDSLHLHSSERSSPLSSSQGGSTRHSPNSQPFISLSTSQSLSGDLYKTAPTDLNKHCRGALPATCALLPVLLLKSDFCFPLSACLLHVHLWFFASSCSF